MYKNYLIISISILLSQNLNALDIDTIYVDSSALLLEERFQDSIHLLNLKNKKLKQSRDAYNEGVSYFTNLKYLESINSFTRAISIDTMFYEAYFNRAKAYMQLKQIDN